MQNFGGGNVGGFGGFSCNRQNYTLQNFPRRMALLRFVKFINQRGDNSGGNTLSQATLLPNPDSSLNKVIPSLAL